MAEQLKAEQVALLEAVKSKLQNFNKDVTPRYATHLETRLDSLQTMHAEYRENRRVLIQTINNDKIKADYIVKNITELFEEVYIDMMAAIKTKVQGQILNSTMMGGNGSLNITVDDVKLPTVKLPIFTSPYLKKFPI